MKKIEPQCDCEERKREIKELNMRPWRNSTDAKYRENPRKRFESLEDSKTTLLFLDRLSFHLDDLNEELDSLLDWHKEDEMPIEDLRNGIELITEDLDYIVTILDQQVAVRKAYTKGDE